MRNIPIIISFCILTACGGGADTPSASVEPKETTPAEEVMVTAAQYLQLQRTTPTALTLQWFDAAGAAGYDIFRDNKKIATVAAGLYIFSDTDLLENHTYDYQVIAFNLCGQRSEPVTIQVTTQENREPVVTPPVSPLIMQDSVTADEVLVQIQATDADHHYLGYRISLGDEAGVFIINNNGEIRLKDNSTELGGKVFSLVVEVSDGLSVKPVSLQVGFVSASSDSEGWGLQRGIYKDSSIGSSLATLKNFADFPDQPDETTLVRDFIAPSNVGSHYGQIIHGYLLPKVSGSYSFAIASDDQGELSLSRTLQDSEADVIASVSGHTSALQWDKYSSQTSETFELQAGQAYYIRALMTEGSGGDHLAVAWQGPGIEQGIITDEYLRPPLDFQAPSSVFDLSWLKTADDEIMLEWNPATDNTGIDHYRIYSANVKLAETTENRIALTGLKSGKRYNFYVVAVDGAGNRSANSRLVLVIIDDFIAPEQPTALQAETGLNYLTLHWQASADESNQSVLYRIYVDEKRVASTYETTYRVNPLLSGTEYKLQIEAVDVTGNSSGMTEPLSASTLQQDPDAPVIAYPYYEFGVSATAQPESIFATLMAVDGQGGELNYRLAAGNENGYFAINDAGQLSLAQVFPDDNSARYQLTVTIDNGIQSTNVEVAVNVIESRLINVQGVSQQVWTGIGGNAISDINLTAAASREQTLSDFKTPYKMGDKYGQRLRAYLKVPETGDYNFWLASDDAGELRISSDISPQKAELVARISGYTGIDSWQNKSQVKTNIRLNAGQLYYIEALHKEGGGGDHLSVAWQSAGTGSAIETKGLLTGQYLIPHSRFYPASPQLQNVYQTGFEHQGDQLHVELTIGEISAGFPVYIYFGEMDAGASTEGWQYVKSVGDLTAGNHSFTLGAEHNIEPGKTYYIRIMTQGPAGSSWSSVSSVVTSTLDPLLTAGESLPQQISLSIDVEGDDTDEVQHIELRKHSVRSPHVQLLTFDSRRIDQYQTIAPEPEVRTYRGNITNNPFVVVTGVVDNAGTLHITGWRGDGRAWRQNEDISHLIDTDALGNSEIQTEALAVDFVIPESENNQYYLPQPGSDFHTNLARVSFRHRNSQFVAKAGGNIVNALAQMEGHINELDYVWAQKTGLRWNISQALIEVNGDMTNEGMQSRPPAKDGAEFRIDFQDPRNGGYCWGGGDWVGCVANYTLNWGFTHEIGHNMGLGHGEQTDNNNQTQAPGTQLGNMQARKTTRRLQTGSKFRPAKALEDPMLPAAFKDYLTVYSNETGSLDPLANDYDANGEALSISGFDPLTQAGGRITRNGDLLTYTPPVNFTGVDQFVYTVTDGEYFTRGPVQIQVLKPGLTGDWDMGEIADNKVIDKSGEGNDLSAPDLTRITPETTLDDLRIAGNDDYAMTIPLLADKTAAPDALGHELLPHKLDPGHKSFTASLWFKYSDIIGDKLLTGKSSSGPKNMAYGGWEIRSHGSDLSMQVSYRDRLMVENAVTITQPNAIVDGVWHHVVMVVDRENRILRGYLDGTAFEQEGVLPESDAPIMAAMNTSGYGGGSPFKVGGHAAVSCTKGEAEDDLELCSVATDQAFDNIKIYHRALTEDESRDL